MANEPDRFTILMERVAQVDQQAAQELFDEYREPIILVVRKSLQKHPRLRSLFDSTDFLQDVWEYVFAHPDKLLDFATFRAFLKYLARMAHNKVEKAHEKYSTQKRDLCRVRHLSDAGVTTTAAGVADRIPNPAEQAADSEQWMQWILSLPRRQRKIALMLRDGFSYQEVAEELDCSVRSIERRMAKLRSLQPPLPLPYL